MFWYQLNVAGNPTQPNAYTQVSTPSCAAGTNQICGIQADDNGAGKPDITDSLKDEMILALHSRTPSTNVKLKA